MSPLPPGSTIGVLGGGQLGRMLAIAAAKLGLKTHIYAPEADSPAADVAARFTCAAYDDEAALAAFAADIDAATTEFENVPAATAAFLAARVPMRPSARALAIAQDRVAEKQFLNDAGAATAPWAAIDDAAALTQALARIGAPAILKTRRMGYDGKGQARIMRAEDAPAALAAMKGAPAILEGFVRFNSEISVVIARGANGETAAFDPGANIHEDGILRETRVPAPLPCARLAQAQALAAKIAAALDYVGVLGVEMFETEDGLIVNEIAPRVHNTGHWTIEACAVSQFEQQIRAVAGWPLGRPDRHADAVMTNLLGAEALDWETRVAEPGLALHLYGKGDARPGRKMGHVTRLTPRQDSPIKT